MEIYIYLLTCHRTQNPHLKYCNIQEGQRRPKLHQLHQSCLHCFDIFYTSLSKLMLSTKQHFISYEFASSAQNVNHILIIVSKLIFIYSLYIRQSVERWQLYSTSNTIDTYCQMYGNLQIHFTQHISMLKGKPSKLLYSRTTSNVIWEWRSSFNIRVVVMMVLLGVYYKRQLYVHIS